jgi:hypothetical protein
LSDIFLWPADKPLEQRDSEKPSSISDAALTFINEMLEAARTLRPSARMSFIAYWSTWKAPVTARPLDGVFLEIAPMFRCFSHSIADPECPINSRDILPVIEDLVKVFDPAEAHVLGYWLDASLFGRSRYKALAGRLPQMGDITKRDLKYYKSRGIRNISTFAVGIDRDYLAKYASPMLFQYPALLWHVESDLEPELVDFCMNYYGSRDISEVFQMNEQIEPQDATAIRWEALADRFSSSRLIAKEILHGTTDDIYHLRLGRLVRELKHMSDWVDGMSRDADVK